MHIVVFVTAKDAAEADKIATKLLENKLIACANIIKDVQSKFWWDKKMDKADEVLLVLKSHRDCFDKIIKAVKKEHSYDVPEVIALPIIGGNKDYLKWIDDNCHKD